MLDVLQQAIEIAPGPLLDEVAPQIDDLSCCRRRFEARQALAHHERDRILDRRVGAVGDLLVFAAAMVAVLEHRRDVPRDAGHPARADRLDARLLDCIVDGARRLAVRREAAVDGGVMAGEPERHRIGVAAQDRHILERHAARRLGQAGLVAHERGPVGRKGDLEIGLPRDRAHAAGDRALQRLGRRFLLIPGLAVRDGHLDLAGTYRPVMTTRRSRSFPAVPCRRSAGRTRRRGGAPARRTCSGTSRGRRSRYR